MTITADLHADLDDAALAAALAELAGKRLLALQADQSLEGAALGKAGDRVANALLMDALAAARPHDAVLCEESADDGRRIGASRAWIVDPLDGTREYAERRGDWAVHVALCVDGRPVAGAVALPACGFIGRTDDARHVPATALERPWRLVVSRSRPGRRIPALAAALGAVLQPMGSAGAKAMAVVRGEADAYLHEGGQHEWDSAAPVAVALAHGLHASRLDGSPLIYNRADPFMPDLMICRRECRDALLAAWRVQAGQAGC